LSNSTAYYNIIIAIPFFPAYCGIFITLQLDEKETNLPAAASAKEGNQEKNILPRALGNSKKNHTTRMQGTLWFFLTIAHYSFCILFLKVFVSCLWQVPASSGPTCEFVPKAHQLRWNSLVPLFLQACARENISI